MLVGAVPALLTLFIRLFVPESEKWQKEKDAGTASCWATRDLIGVLIGAAAAAGVITLWVGERPMFLRIGGSIAGLVVVTLGFLYPARQFLWRSGLPPAERRRTLRLMLLAAGLSGVPLLATWSGVMWMYMFVPTLPNAVEYPNAKAWMQVSSSIGAAAGCVASAAPGWRLGPTQRRRTRRTTPPRSRRCAWRGRPRDRAWPRPRAT